MERIEKALTISAQKADAERDIALVNQYSQKELSPEEVYCFTMDISNTEVDRDLERFTEKTLRELAPMFVGKPVQKDHRWGTDATVARIYHTKVLKTGETASHGEEMTVLRARAYMLRTENNQPLIDSLEGGIVNGVSVGCRTKKCNCSICGKPQHYDWRNSHISCENGHVRGETYEKKLCVGLLEEAQDAYEVSFAAVPSNRVAGVVKSAGTTREHIEALLEATDLNEHTKAFESLMDKFKQVNLQEAERKERAEIIKSAERYCSAK